MTPPPRTGSPRGAQGDLNAEPPPRPEPPPSGAPDVEAECRFLARLLDQTTQPYALVDFDGRITRVNRAFAALLGYPAEELTRLTLRDITPPRWVEATAEPLERLRQTGRAVRYEKEYSRKDGGVVPVEVVADVYRDDDGAPQGYFAFITDITERKQAERALRESEERFRLLYDEAPVGYHEIDPDGTIVSINRTECELLGYAREEMLGRPIFDFVDESEREAARRAVREKIAGLRPLRTLERTYRRRDGQTLIVSIADRLTFDEAGHVVGIRSTVQDITAKKQTEAALVASERRARVLFEGIEDAVFVHDLDGRILDANPAACRHLGYTREELLRLSTREIDDPEFAAGFEDRLRQQLERGQLTFEGRHRTKDGRTIPVDINSATIQLEDRPAILAVMRDITEHKALEETRRQFAEAQMRNAQAIAAKNRALTESEARYRQLTEASLDAVVVADAEGRVTLFNPAAEQAFGYAAAEVLGRPLSLLIPDDADDPRNRDFALRLRARDPRLVGRTVELRGRRKDGEAFPLELSLNAVGSDEQLQFIGSIRDQTERHRMRAMLIQSEKLASIGLLSAGVAHEINNPLSYIANNLAVLERDLKGVLEMVAAYEAARDRLAAAAPEALARVDELARELDWDYVRDNLGRMIARTRDGVQRVANIVQNLRGLARTSPAKMEAAALSDLIAGALEMVQGRLRRGQIDLTLDVPPDLPKVPCVAQQVSQVILNLLVNALQAIESSGRGGGAIRVAVRREDGHQALEVADTGPGIPPEDLPHLFDPFFTTKPVGEGTGLGLAISHGIITGHGGRIEVEGRPGQGALFRIVLPETPR